MKKVLYVKINQSSFIKKDEIILKKHFDVKCFLLNKSSLSAYFWSLFKLTIFILRNAQSTDVFFTRFADFHACLLAFLSKRLKKKLIVVIGGFDVTAIPEYGYGGHISKYQSKAIKYALNHADYLLPNSDALIANVNKYTGVDCPGGIKYFAPNHKGRVEVIYNGFDLDFWKYFELEKQKSVITVVHIEDYKTFVLKGMDDFLKAAELMPDVSFTICGMRFQFIKESKINIPENVEVFEYISHEEMIGKLQKAKVFTLLSISEGMPNALCEAMLNKCIPVVSNVTSMPEIVGETGFVVQKKNVEEIVKNLKLALESDGSLGEKARKRIAHKFDLKQRETALVDLLNSLN